MPRFSTKNISSYLVLPIESRLNIFLKIFFSNLFTSVCLYQCIHLFVTLFWQWFFALFRYAVEQKKSQRKHFREPVVSHHLSSGETSVTLLGCVTPAGFSCRDGVESKAHQSVGQSLRQREGGSPLVLQLNSSLDGLFV